MIIIISTPASVPQLGKVLPLSTLFLQVILMCRLQITLRIFLLTGYSPRDLLKQLIKRVNM